MKSIQVTVILVRILQLVLNVSYLASFLYNWEAMMCIARNGISLSGLSRCNLACHVAPYFVVISGHLRFLGADLVELAAVKTERDKIGEKVCPLEDDKLKFEERYVVLAREKSVTEDQLSILDGGSGAFVTTSAISGGGEGSAGSTCETKRQAVGSRSVDEKSFGRGFGRGPSRGYGSGN